MESKTISYLNGKAWYRLLKVAYVFAFLLVSLGAIAIVSNLYETRQVDDYRVVCNYGSKTNFLAHKDKGIYLSDYELRNGLTDIPDYEKESLQAACGISKAEINNMINAFYNNPPQGKRLLYDPTNPPPALFSITKEQTITGGIAEVVGYSLLTVLVIALVFEIVRRAFYYVVLGSVKPAK